MECGLKRTLDDAFPGELYNLSNPIGLNYPDCEMEQVKRMRLSVQFNAPPGSSVVEEESFAGSSSETATEASWTWEARNVLLPNDMDFDDKGDSCGQDDLSEDIPSTSEVINSLRKVILWMSAQGDSNNDYIEYLTAVERYAQSKQLNIAQQRKITQYFIRCDQ